MKKILWIGLVSAGLNFSALGATYADTFPGGLQNGSTVPVGSLNGWSDTITVPAQGQNILDLGVTVSVTLSGGAYNGALYAYISHDGQTAVLLNRVGVGSANAFGNTGSGINVTFDSTLANTYNIHYSAPNGPLSGTYAPDGETLRPLEPPSHFTSAPYQNALDATFAGTSPDGTWTLFFADAVSGGGSVTVNSWSLGLDPLPEPVNVALGIFGLCAVGAAVVRRTKRLRDHETTGPRDHGTTGPQEVGAKAEG